MINVISLLSDKFYVALQKAYPQIWEYDSKFSLEIVPSTHEKFGDYQCNSSMRIGKLLRENPLCVAQNIAHFVNREPLIEKIEIAGPGFINITLSAHFLSHAVQKMLENPHLGIASNREKKKIIVEFSSPNIAKELHVGHLRSTIIGDCLARVFEFLGHDVIRLNHVGDWGTSFGMLIAYLKAEHPAILTGEKKTDLSHLVEWYKTSKKRFDEEPAFKKASQMEVISLQAGDRQSLKAWQIICAISRKAYQEIYDLLDVKLEERGESFYNPQLPELIEELEAQGMITVSDGAKCIFLPEFKNRQGDPMPLMVQKSDGGFGYDTTDMAAMKHRVQQIKADRIIIVTDAGQALHFQMIAAASLLAGYLDPKNVQFDHVPFGLVLGPDGKKFRTRKGETQRLADLLYKAVEKADSILQERKPDMEKSERKKIARALGIGAVKYADLSSHRTGDYTFSYDRMLRFEGNTAAFLMYAYVRIIGIKRKANYSIDHALKEESIKLDHPSEIALGMHLVRFAEAIDQVASDLLPHRLTEYLFILAEKFNAFYRDCQVEGSEAMLPRLLLSEVTARTLKTGLHLLGVETVERM